MLKLICSPNREDTITYIYDLVGKGAKEGRRQLVVVPETHSHRAEKRLLSQCGNPAGIYAKVSTFSRLADRALEAHGGQALPIDHGARVLLMYKAVRGVESSLEYYKNAAMRADMLSGLISVASELRSCLIQPEDLMANYHSLNPKLRDVSLIYTAYRALCEGRPAHGADKIEAALPYITESPLVKDAEIYVYGFEGFTAAEYLMLGKMIEGGVGLTVSLNLEESSQLFSEQIKTKGRLERLGERYGEKWQVEAAPHSSRGRDQALELAASAMFDFSSPAFGGDSQSIRLYECKDVYQECELVAGICRSLTLREGVRLGQIGVVTSEAEKYEKHLQQSFARYGLPMYISRKEDFLDKPPVLAALGALRAIEENLSMSSMLRYMKSDLVGLSRDCQELLENYVYTWQIRGNRWLSYWNMPPEGYDMPEKPQLLEQINEIRSRLTEPLAALKASLPSTAEGSVYIAALRRHLGHIDLLSQIEERAAELEGVGRRQEAAEYLQIMDIMDGALEQFDSVLGGDVISRSDFLSLLELMLSQYTIGTIPVSLDAVEFSDFGRAAFGSIDYLFVIGAAEGTLPPVVTGGSLLKERDRIMLETCGIELTQSDEERTFEYMSDIYQMVDSAVKGLYFTYPKKTFGGTEVTKSYLLGQLEKVFPESAARPCGSTAAKNALLATIPAFEQLCVDSGDASAAAYEFFSGREEGRRYEALRKYSSSNRGPIASLDAIRRLYGESVYMSATRAEKINACRFAYFMEYGLKARERRKAEFKATNVGTLVHYVVENAVKEMTFTHAADADKVVDKYVEEFLTKRLGGAEDKTARFMANYSFLKENIRQIVKDIIDEIQKSDFKPIAFEMDFGGQGGFPPYRASEGGTTLEVHGQIDRVDGYVKDDVLYVRVSDYKTGSKAFSLSDILDGLNMQMFIYLLMIRGISPSDMSNMAQAALGETAKDISPCAALYIPVKSPFVEALPSSSHDEIVTARHSKVKRIGLVTDDHEIIEALEHPQEGKYRFLPVGFKKDGQFTAASKVADNQTIELLLKKTEKNLKKIAEVISEGQIEANPYALGGGRSYCDWCPYRQACQFDLGMEKDKYRYLKSYKNDEVFKLLAEEEEGESIGC